MTRVLWLIKGLGPGGAERLLVSLAGELQGGDDLSCRVAYLLPWKDHLVPELAALGVPATCLSTGKLWDLRWVWRLLRLVRRERIDVVHVHSPALAALARLPLRLLVRPRPAIVYTEHNNWGSYGPVTRLLHRWTFRLDDAQLAVSDDARASVPARLRERVEVLVHGVPLEPLREHLRGREAARRDLGIGAGEVVILTVANLRLDKDYPTLLEAASLVDDPRVRFLAVGQGPLEATIRERHRDLGLGDRFRLLGYRDDVPRLLAAADVFAMSSVVEGYPVALMEAMAMGLPVVATAVGGVPAAVRHGQDGLLVPARDPSALAAAVQQLADDPERRARLAASAAERGTDYSITRSAARLRDLYAGLSSGRSA